MYKYIFNSNGKYVAFIFDNTFCFYPDGGYIGFFQGINLYNKQGEYVGTLTSDDRIVRKKNIKMPKITPPLRPLRPIRPLAPLNRYSMPRLPFGYEEIHTG